MSEIILRQIEHHMMAGSDSNGHSIVIGRSPVDHNHWVGVKPSDLLLMSIAACATYDVVDILKKRREEYQELIVICTGDQEEDPPYTFTRIHLQYKLRGLVDPTQLGRAIRLSIEKYCSVINTLRKDIPVTSDFEIIS